MNEVKYVKTPNKHKIAPSILAIAISMSLLLVPNAWALNMSFSDPTWEYFVVTGPNTTKIGNVEIFTVSGKLSANASGAVHVRLWMYNVSQLYKVLLDDDALIAGNYVANSSFAKSYQVTIPSDAENNKYIYATVAAGLRHFNNITLTLVQNPTYPELQSQLSQSQAEVGNLTKQVSELQNSSISLQSQLNSSKTQNSALQAQLDSLQGNNTVLLSEAEELQRNITTLQAKNNATQTELSILQNNTSLSHEGNFTEMQSEIDQLCNETLTLRAGLNETDAQLGTKTLLMYATTAAAVALAGATGFLIFRVRRGKKPQPLQVPKR